MARSRIMVPLVCGVLALTTVVACYGLGRKAAPRIAYVNTSRLMTGFADAAAVQRQLQAEEEAAKAQLKQLEDTLQASIDQMSKEYNAAPAARRKQLQDLLSARNQQVNDTRGVRPV